MPSGALESRLGRLPFEQLCELARRNGIAVARCKQPGTRGRKFQRQSPKWILEQLLSLARTGRDLGAK